MTEREKERAIWIGGLLVVVLLLWFLWRRAHVGAASPAQQQAAQSAAAGTPVILGSPPGQINLSFQNPDTSGFGLRTGYVPLFGFLGFGTQWA